MCIEKYSNTKAILVENLLNMRIIKGFIHSFSRSFANVASGKTLLQAAFQLCGERFQPFIQIKLHSFIHNRSVNSQYAFGVHTSLRALE